MEHWLKIKTDHEHKENERKKQLQKDVSGDPIPLIPAPKPEEYGYPLDSSLNIPSAKMPR